MKKTMLALMATVGLAFCAKADPLNKADFESYAEGPFDYTLDDSAGTQGSRYWAVTNAEAEAVGTVTAYEEPGEDNDNYLAVDTNGEILYRSVEALGDTSALNDEGYNIGSGLYLDAEVKFTATEEASVTPGKGDKLIVWLYADEEGTTNLMVTAGVYDEDHDVYTPTAFPITNVGSDSAEIVPDSWYRLTVKAAVVNSKTVFTVYIDGKQASSGETSVFSSLVDSEADGGKAISAVGFKGTGALDNVVWTTEDPFPVVETTFPMTLTVVDEGSATDTALYVQDAVVTNDFTSGVAVDVLKETTTITIVVGVFEGSEVTDFTKGDSYENNDGDPCTYYTKDVAVTPEMLAEGYALTITVVQSGEEATDISTAVVELSADSIKVGEACPTVTSVTVSEVPLALGTDYTVAYPDVSTEGEKTITLTGIGKYTGTATATFTVTAAEPTTVVTPTADEIASGEIPVTDETTAIKIGTIEVPIEAFDVNDDVATVKAPVVAESAEAAGDAFVIDDDNDEVTINVNPVEGLYYGVSADADIDKLARPKALKQFDGTNAAEIFTVSKPGAEKGFFKVYSDVKE